MKKRQNELHLQILLAYREKDGGPGRNVVLAKGIEDLYKIIPSLRYDFDNTIILTNYLPQKMDAVNSMVFCFCNALKEKGYVLDANFFRVPIDNYHTVFGEENNIIEDSFVISYTLKDLDII